MKGGLAPEHYGWHVPLIDTGQIPVHVAIVMDGNGRWAEERKRPRLFGHQAGVKSVRTVVETAREIGVKHLTLYAFSTENWRRPSLEVKGLMTLLNSYLSPSRRTMLKNDIRLQCLGQQDNLPPEVQENPGQGHRRDLRLLGHDPESGLELRQSQRDHPCRSTTGREMCRGGTGRE